ncbi:Nmad3 family putative nucleotide modification protein [Haladaptatus sp. NG-SE-30]
MVRAVAINVAANTNQPGVRGPIHPDGSFEYVPIPESEPTSRPVPTYADLDLAVELPDGTADRPVHLDPEFAEYPCCERYTYGDPFGVKARPLLELDASDYVFFYATLSTVGEPERAWIAPDWGAYIIGQFRLASKPISGDEFAALDDGQKDVFENNAHVKREEFDAAVLLVGSDDGSGLYETAVPLSSSANGSEANRVVTELSSDSGKGPWWRRPMKFGGDGVEEVLEMREDGVFW